MEYTKDISNLLSLIHLSLVFWQGRSLIQFTAYVSVGRHFDCLITQIIIYLLSLLLVSLSPGHLPA